ncbi:UNVERIFIED_CONTAM: hypothetical protein PYX00_002042 [Menopon gallinae]|uniref:dTCF n=1 Tax=Menopon gallinae TaxID=328185 RepID=A0AAW2IGW3_9NEOP
MEQWCPSPLNLVKKTKPVAIVAPSSKVTKDDSDPETKVERQEPIEDARAKLTHTTKYHIERLLEKDDNSDRDATGCSNNLYNMVSDLSSTEQQVLAAIYMRDLMTSFSQNPYFRYGGYIPPPFFGAYDNYRRFLMESRGGEAPKEATEEPPKTDPYPFLRERLNSRPVYEADAEDEEEDEEEDRTKKKPDYEESFHAKAEDKAGTEQGMDEPLNLRVTNNNNNNEEPLDFSRKSKSFVLSPNPSVSLTLNLKSPEFESLSKPLVLTIPNPQERTPKAKKKEKCSRSKRSSSIDHKNSGSSHHNAQDSKNHDSGSQNDKKKPHIKKPLNAFMLYMKEMRAKVVAECTLKESAAINQILGRRWHALGREEQAKYYELARRERQLHMQLYPDWSSRANSSRGKKRKRKQEANDGGNNMKKCRARYGLDQQSQWCKPCSPDTVSGSGTAMTPSGALHGMSTVLHGAASNSGALGVASPQEPTYVNL